MFLYLVCISLCFINTVHSRDKQIKIDDLNPVTQLQQERMQQFMRSINFSKQGIRCFIKHVYNAKEYADFVVNNFMHLTEFMQRTTDMPRIYQQSVIRMFHNKIKQSLYVNPYALSELLDEMITHLKKAYYNTASQAYDKLHTSISSIMHDTMLNKFDQLKQNPDGFFNELSHNIINLVGTRHDLNGDIPVADLRSTLLLFLQNSLSKLVWSPNDAAGTWLNVKLIADQLARYHQQGIIDNVDDLDDLYTTLLERFYLYLDLAYTELDMATLEAMRTDIASGTLALFEIETEEHFLTKADRFNQVAADVEVKIQAYQQGILVR